MGGIELVPERVPIRAAKPETHECPRCGYDQSGLAAIWTDRCPLKGVCSECGLEFAWVDVLRPARNDLPWFYEHTARWQIGMRRAWRTWRRTLNPHRFWSEVSLSSRLNPWRAVLWPLLIYLCVHAAHAIAWTLSISINHYAWVLAAAPGSRRKTGWTLGWVEYLEPWVAPVLRATYTPAGGRTLELTTDLRQIPPGALAMVCAGVIVPTMLVLLSASRRISKVRPAHILRAACFGMAWLAIFPALFAAYSLEEIVALALGPGLSPYRADESWTLSLINDRWPVLVAMYVAWFMWWWHGVISRGLRLRHAWLVWSLLMIAAALAALVTALLHPDVLWWMAKWKLF